MRATTANSFGFRVLVCPHCRGCNTCAVGKAEPTECHHCGKAVSTEEWER